MIHPEPHPLAGQTITVEMCHSEDADPVRREFIVEDWYDRVAGESWTESTVFAAYQYGERVALAGLPMDNQVIYGKAMPGRFGHLVHIREIVPESTPGGAS